MNWRWLLLPWSIFIAQSTSGAWLGICYKEQQSPTSHVLSEYFSPRKISTALLIDKVPMPNCASIELPIASKSVVSGRLVSPDLSAAFKSGFALTGHIIEQQFRLSDVIPETEKENLNSIPLEVEFVNDLSVSTFGVEGRESVLDDDVSITLNCTQGQSVAGMIVSFPFHELPHTFPLTTSIAYIANGNFELGLSDSNRTSIGDPLLIAELQASKSALHVDIPTDGLDVDHIESFTIICPKSEARFKLTSLTIQPKVRRTSVSSRALWVWQPDVWIRSPETLLKKLRSANVGTLFVNVPIDMYEGKVAHPRELRYFVNSATQRGVKVWAVVGDPEAVLESQRAVFARYPKAYELYNSTEPPSSQLAGIQFDIEPYLNAGYSLEPLSWYEAYLDTLRQIRKASVMPIDIAVPFWWANEQTAGGLLMDRLAALVDSVTVMDYRTDPAQIKRFAQPFLEWGERNRHSIHIALESGFIPNEVQHHYLPKPHGDYALVQVDSYLALLKFDRELSFPETLSNVHTFHLSHETTVSGSDTTFAGQHEKLLKLLPELESLWSSWTSFSGTALHELEP